MSASQIDLATLRTKVDAAVQGLGMINPETDGSVRGERRVGDMRRRRSRRIDDGVGMLTLVERDGVLFWEDGAFAGGPLRGRRGSAEARPAGEIVAQYKFEHLKPNQVTQALADLDAKLTPEAARSPLRALTPAGALKPVARPAAKGRVLLLVHGTFSNCDTLMGDLRATAEGREFVARASRKYDQVLAFDHRTLSVSPMLNALELARWFDGSRAAVHVVCHSRGGLVSHWWTRALPPGTATVERVVCVGSPLAGTSLAAPPRLRGAMSLLANVGNALGAAAMAVPLLTAASGLMKLLSSAAAMAAKTPLVDAAVALVPGLAAQSRVGNNPEILELRRCAPRREPEYFAITSNFEPRAPGWKFWEWFRAGRLADLGADIVFDGPNDLVVDTSAMVDLADGVKLPASQVHAYGKNGEVHHCNYFEQAATIGKLREWLAV